MIEVPPLDLKLKILILKRIEIKRKQQNSSTTHIKRFKMSSSTVPEQVGSTTYITVDASNAGKPAPRQTYQHPTTGNLHPQTNRSDPNPPAPRPSNLINVDASDAGKVNPDPVSTKYIDIDVSDAGVPHPGQQVYHAPVDREKFPRLDRSDPNLPAARPSNVITVDVSDAGKPNPRSSHQFHPMRPVKDQ
jgi:hypothetical protein